MDEIASDGVLDLAYQWLSERRKDYRHNMDVWDVRWRWSDLKSSPASDSVRTAVRP